jgi:hypothetical protein
MGLTFKQYSFHHNSQLLPGRLTYPTSVVPGFSRLLYVPLPFQVISGERDEFEGFW